MRVKPGGNLVYDGTEDYAFHCIAVTRCETEITSKEVPLLDILVFMVFGYPLK
jgi:hypothetical protein